MQFYQLKMYERALSAIYHSPSIHISRQGTSSMTETSETLKGNFISSIHSALKDPTKEKNLACIYSFLIVIKVSLFCVATLLKVDVEQMVK